MCVTESVDDVVGIVITGTTIPAAEPRVGTELDHTKRHRHAGKCVSMPACADERIDVVNRRALRRSRESKYQQQRQTAKGSGHFCSRNHSSRLRLARALVRRLALPLR